MFSYSSTAAYYYYRHHHHLLSFVTIILVHWPPSEDSEMTVDRPTDDLSICVGHVSALRRKPGDLGTGLKRWAATQKTSDSRSADMLSQQTAMADKAVSL